MGKVCKFKRNGKQVFPKTITKAVIDATSKKRLDVQLGELTELIDEEIKKRLQLDFKLSNDLRLLKTRVSALEDTIAIPTSEVST